MNGVLALYFSCTMDKALFSERKIIDFWSSAISYYLQNNQLLDRYTTLANIHISVNIKRIKEASFNKAKAHTVITVWAFKYGRGEPI